MITIPRGLQFVLPEVIYKIVDWGVCVEVIAVLLETAEELRGGLLGIGGITFILIVRVLGSNLGIFIRSFEHDRLQRPLTTTWVLTCRNTRSER